MAVLLLLSFVAVGSSCNGTGVDWQGRSDLQLREYRAAFEAEAGTNVVAGASTAEFVNQLRDRRALWLGDHHRDPQLHLQQRQLVRAVLATGTRCCLLLEAIGVEDQPAIDDYLAGRRSMDRLVAVVRARWPQSWLSGSDVDSEHYRELLRIARDSRTPALALEPTPRLPLKDRDTRIAAQVAAAARAHEDCLLVVVLGQSHLLGHGRVPARTGLPSLLVGATPPRALVQQFPRRSPHDLLRTDQGLWFFVLD